MPDVLVAVESLTRSCLGFSSLRRPGTVLPAKCCLQMDGPGDVSSDGGSAGAASEDDDHFDSYLFPATACFFNYNCTQMDGPGDISSHGGRPMAVRDGDG